MHTVAIPAEIVGDTETLEWRLRRTEHDLMIDGRAIAQHVRSGGEVDHYWTDDLVCHDDTRRALEAELRRRRVALGLAWADRPELYAWTDRLVRGVR